MYIHTTEAAELLGIPPRRLLILLNQGRVVGAYKSGRCWIIPLFDGLPTIIPGTRGRRGTWKTQEDSNTGKKRNQKKTIIHINGNHIKQNNKRGVKDRKPVIVIRGKQKVYANRLEIPYPCRIVYQPEKPLRCGAKVWIEVLGFDLAEIQLPGNLLSSEN
ncbi:MAG: hypothetical protein QNJ18_10340 [Xenococcaceae cyanobacterium MO_167.B52]|nr:hypothetical protein [Xenococcaceae cyanobacterium MO_167.B52]